VIYVSVVVHDDGRVDLEGDELNLAMWNHDPDRLQDVLDYAGRAVWKPRFHVLAVPGPSGYLFNLAPSDKRTQCHPGARQARGESTLDFVVRAAREDHGFTVPLPSFRPPEVVGGRGQNERDVNGIKEKV
jgi:hypothetical protein